MMNLMPLQLSSSDINFFLPPIILMIAVAIYSVMMKRKLERTKKELYSGSVWQVISYKLHDRVIRVQPINGTIFKLESDVKYVVIKEGMDHIFYFPVDGTTNDEKSYISKENLNKRLTFIDLKYKVTESEIYAIAGHTFDA